MRLNRLLKTHQPYFVNKKTGYGAPSGACLQSYGEAFSRVNADRSPGLRSDQSNGYCEIVFLGIDYCNGLTERRKAREILAQGGA